LPYGRSDCAAVIIDKDNLQERPENVGEETEKEELEDDEFLRWRNEKLSRIMNVKTHGFDIVGVVRRVGGDFSG